jgi:hypothetical protein
MATGKMNPDPRILERKIQTALEATPRLEVPAGFAARVAAVLPPRPEIALTPRRYGVRVAMICLLALVVVLPALAPKIPGSSLYWLSIQTLFCGQFVLVTVWLVGRRDRSRGSF